MTAPDIEPQDAPPEPKPPGRRLASRIFTWGPLFILPAGSVRATYAIWHDTRHNVFDTVWTAWLAALVYAFYLTAVGAPELVVRLPSWLRDRWRDVTGKHVFYGPTPKGSDKYPFGWFCTLCARKDVTAKGFCRTLHAAMSKAELHADEHVEQGDRVYAVQKKG